MVSNLDPVFSLSIYNHYLVILIKCLGNTIINVYRNYDSLCIESAPNSEPPLLDFFSERLKTLNERTNRMKKRPGLDTYIHPSPGLGGRCLR